MIDTVNLEAIIAAVRSHKGLINHEVKRVQKAPDYISIDVVNISTQSNEATLRILMGWPVDRFVRYSESWTEPQDDFESRLKQASLSNHNTLRAKWFFSIVNKLNDRSDRLVFMPSDFEFGVGDGCMWATMRVDVREVGG